MMEFVKEGLDPIDKLTSKLSGVSDSRVFYCQCTYDKDIANTKECVRQAAPHVDGVIIVEDGSISRDDSDYLSQFKNVTVLTVQFDDSLPAFRRAYVEKAKELKADWILQSDPDEHFNLRFLEDLKPKIIPDLEAKGYNMAGVKCVEAFTAVDWLDDLDRLKESPGGRESNFWKNLLYRCYDDLRMEGVGTTKSVHETWYSPSHPWKSVNLPGEYSYEHKKTALDIWTRAARNLYIGGGGDNVGSLNPLWKPLRDIWGNRAWREVREHVESGKLLPHGLVPWIQKALRFSASDYGTECREFAKWVVFYHRSLLKNRMIAYGVKHPPKMTEKEEVEAFVRRAYFDVLGRHPDRGGLDSYTGLIMRGELKKEDLHGLLRASPEWKQKFGEKVKVQAPVDVTVQVTEAMILEAFSRSKLYAEVIKPRLDVGRWVLEGMGEEERKRFLKRFYAGEVKTLKDV